MVIEILLIFGLILFVYVSLASLAWINAKRRNALYWSDICLPIVLLLVWTCLVSVGYGHQSLSHLIEIPILLMVSVIFLYVRVFIVDRYRGQFKQNSYIILGLGVLLVLLLRTFMPFLAE
ncbi:hypothetical protein [Photobacterium carnosum]|uniref:hypothetical protein n=1 Tax=Photobacterium carnosum TaxID=2023717 RepID=UPI00128CA8D6|nr:hypothetical protein [Photobacterium carnosum]KAE8178088.1 hypothetical protein CIT27_04940 [Photobacterium carnosum]MBY3788543.1 hypothetical protein [Photobacterium carnosum]MCD9513493.1 hypothetical protein [Photobacterium carnosum]MCD9533832.1 hypothetical protein [Photobacterium carnosum]MCD9536004.1 hypothetical protein [Photobacterium carnosum]